MQVCASMVFLCLEVRLCVYIYIKICDITYELVNPWAFSPVVLIWFRLSLALCSPGQDRPSPNDYSRGRLLTP